ncbi:uncharacterized protein [Fopius arisanus]|uniref:Uncharacterized protein n=1 Tax=Fopius arisanus TaxID=64838 RepID=A0A9R1TLI4_9HYME|nr:PREDICTED: uncharacterized protein LOC105271723 [Fopius arisanus]
MVQHNFLHKSAVATFCSGKSSSSISSDFLVRQVLKATSIARSREIKADIWDAQLLLNWLSTTIPDSSLFQLSRRSAALLLLIPGRRIHDLTLLKVSNDYLSYLGDEMILWPAFGSKTDRNRLRQSGWGLSTRPNIRLCPVTLIKAMDL